MVVFFFLVCFLCKDGGDTPGLGLFWPLFVEGIRRERIVSLGCALDLLCILDLLSSLSALGHGKRRRIQGIDRSHGWDIQWFGFGLGLRWGCWGISFTCAGIVDAFFRQAL